VPLEIQEQQAYIQWLDLKKIKYFAVPNVVTLASTLKTIQQKVNFWRMRKNEGVKKGAPDLVVFLPNIILFVEMKRQELSDTSDEQIKWYEIINNYPYAIAIISKGANAAINGTLEAMKM
jgi:hypothetical protein